MSMRHYLDHNATAPVRPEVIEAVSMAMADVGNASSVHHEGRSANAKIEAARDSLRRLVNAPVNGVVFTSGGTEAIHAAINGLVGAGKVERIYVSAIEHPAVSENAKASGATLIAAPYSMYYELVLLVPDVWFVLVRGHDTGWLRFERELVALLLLFSVLVPGPATQMGISLSFAANGLVALILYRRLRVELASA